VEESEREALAEDTVADLLEKVRRTGYSRFPVTRGDLDETIGVVHVKQVFELPHAQRQATALGQLAIRVPVVPSTLDGDALMDQIRANGLQAALVRKMGYPVVDLSKFTAERPAVARIGKALAARLRVLPLIQQVLSE
jgi:hypothetical protein